MSKRGELGVKKLLLFSTLLLLLVPGLIASVFLYRKHVAERFVMDGPSMEPQISAGDRFVVDKREEPKLGDIIALRSPDRPSDVIIKRIVGIGGDEISMEHFALYRNGLRVSSVGSDRPCRGRDGVQMYSLHSEHVGHSTYFAMIDADADRSGERRMPPVRVPRDHFYVLGDYRDRSLDSRRFGPIPRSSVVGVVMGLVHSGGIHNDCDVVSLPR